MQLSQLLDIVQSERPSLKAMLRSLQGFRAVDDDDVVSEVCLLVIAKSSGHFTGMTRERFLRWLYSAARLIGRKTVHSRADYQARLALHSTATNAATPLVVSSYDAILPVSLEFRDIIGCLSPMERQVVELRLTGHSFEDIKAESGMSFGSMKRVWQVARDKLKDRLVDDTDSSAPRAHL